MRYTIWCNAHNSTTNREPTMTKQHPAPDHQAFYGAGREFVFQVGKQQEVVVAGNRTEATAALYAYLKATGNEQPAECIEERDAK